MQDSFDARMQGQTPSTIKPAKSGKGWMVCAIILLIGVIALGVTEFLAYQEMAKKDDEIANLKKQLEEKTATPVEEDGDEPTDDGQEGGDSEVTPGDKTKIDDEDTVKSELDAVVKSKTGGQGYTYKINKFGLTKDQKYYYAYFTISITGGANDSMVYYRAAQGGTWKYMNGGQAVQVCTDLDADALSFMKQYGKEVTHYCHCSDSDGTTHDYSK